MSTTGQSFALCNGLVERLVGLHKALSFVALANGWSSWEIGLSSERVLTITYADAEGRVQVISSDNPVTTWQQIEEMLVFSDVTPDTN